MDRRSLISGALGGAAGVVVGREVAPSAAGAAADVDRSEFEALKAQVEYLAQFHPPMPTAKFSGSVSLPAGFVVPFGEVWDFDPDTSTTVEVGANVVVAGTLRMRPANPGVTHTLRFVGVDESAMVGGGMTPLATDVGLWVVGAGVLDLVGSPKTAWSRLTSGVTAGATSLPLTSTDGWQQGDRITVTPTSAPTPTQAAELTSIQYDARQVGAVSASSVTVPALTYAHPAVTVGDGFTLTAEVLNLTRNVNIEGTPTGRAHVWINSSVAQHIHHVALRHLGPRKNGAGVFGRYPLHLHMQGEASRGSTVTGVVAESCGNHAFVAHESHGVTFDGCVAHDTIDDAFWWDPTPSVTNDCTFRACVASYTRPAQVSQGNRLGGFSLWQGTGNVVEDCVAVGTQGNSLAAGFAWPEGATSIWMFERNIAHNCRMNGLSVWQNSPEEHHVNNFVCYHNGSVGINHGAYANGYRYSRGWLFGNWYSSLYVHTTSRNGLRFGELACDGAGLHKYGLIFIAHTLAATDRTRVEGCTFTGHTIAPLAVVADWVGNPDLVDVVECGDPTIALVKNPSPATSFRVQDGTAAKEITTSGTTTIPTFSTYVKPTVAPFAVVNAA